MQEEGSQLTERRPEHVSEHRPSEEPWKKGKIVGQKRPLKLQEIWAVRTRRQIEQQNRDLALFNLAVDSKLRVSDFVRQLLLGHAKLGSTMRYLGIEIDDALEMVEQTES